MISERLIRQGLKRFRLGLGRYFCVHFSSENLQKSSIRQQISTLGIMVPPQIALVSMNYDPFL